ncbi:carbohydrate sulfotransferase 15 [Biomphalaria pfeifferi]|uniref:Carbohydrate sulfotransferase 15 n=1 Tax=Biomphalaria pfeifferi TaxID=112525 RepID=A0AAD8BNM3_BIOPF|nr:carbohydrate sulfotransferase 15 [Biomphalaria pfeifferi]
MDMDLSSLRLSFSMCLISSLILSVCILILLHGDVTFMKSMKFSYRNKTRLQFNNLPARDTAEFAQEDKRDIEKNSTVDEYSGIDTATYYRGENISDDILSMKPPTFLKNYKNPCWYEQIGNTSNRTLKCLPYFYVIGVDKCGTTDFWHRLTKHPDIETPDGVLNKETHWWSWRRFGFDIWIENKPIEHFDSYLKYFERPAREMEKRTHLNNSQPCPLITGEGSPTMFWDFTGWDKIPQNSGRSAETALLTPDCIKHVTPQAKLIVLFRDPTRRVYSDYLFLDHFRSYHNTSVQSFHQHVLRAIDMLQACFSRHTELFCLYSKQLHMNIPVRLVVGMYDVFLDKWLKVFPTEQILIIRNEDYSKFTLNYLNTTFNFLGLKPLSQSKLEEVEKLSRQHETKKVKDYGQMMNATKAILDKFYLPYNQQLAKRLNDSKYMWTD